MAKIEKDGVYRVGDEMTGTQFQFLKGTEVGDEEVTYVGPYPDAAADKVAERNAKVAEGVDAARPETKVDPAPSPRPFGAQDAPKAKP